MQNLNPSTEQILLEGPEPLKDLYSPSQKTIGDIHFQAKSPLNSENRIYFAFKREALSSCVVDSVFDVIAKSLAEATSVKEYWRVMVGYRFLNIKRTFSIVSALIYDGMCITQECINLRRDVYYTRDDTST